MTENPSAGKPGVLRRYHVKNSPVNAVDPHGLLSISQIKKAVKKVHEIFGKLPKSKKGKFGSPQKGDKFKGYRLEPAHPESKFHPKGTEGTKPHIDWWIRPTGKRKGRDSTGGKVPIEAIVPFIIDFIDPFSADAANEDEDRDDDGNGIPDWEDNYNKKNCPE